MINIGITGQAGFIGSHLGNYLGLFGSEFRVIPFEDNYFNDPARLKEWIAECDTVVHLAAVNRHHDNSALYRINMDLTEKLIGALESSGRKPHILFSSSSQEIKENEYGRSKKEGRLLLSDWAEKSGACFTGLVIPNVFGPFGLPYYNSVVATFCHQLTHSEEPRIDIDGTLKLIYVGELAEVIRKAIISAAHDPEMVIAHTAEKKVSEILGTLERYGTLYLNSGIIPHLNDRYEVNLFNTFRSYIDYENRFPVYYEKKSDNRGYFVEMMKTETGSQISFSTTLPGITRGNHFHTRKVERFAVIAGEAVIRMRRIGGDKVMEFRLSGERPSYVDIPVWYTHNITNAGKGELLTMFWINEFYNAGDPDTFFEDV